MKLKPLFDKVLVKRIDADTKTAGGIIIPDTSKEKPSIGEILSVGDGAINDKGERIRPTLKEGDLVLFSKWGGTEVPQSEDLIILKESDVLGIVIEK
ncbi:MAG: co-chaperone GroES [Rickettsiales bacterium]|jgi:chaperonin GroES|nr:co-chaperone GroES [Rickettsiales bacterium]